MLKAGGRRALGGSEVGLAMLGSVQATWPEAQSACSFVPGSDRLQPAALSTPGGCRGIQQALAFSR